MTEVSVSVIGPGDEATEWEVDAARTVGAVLANRGVTVLTGGLGGVMAAAAEGARLHGGQAVGFLPGRDRPAANRTPGLVLSTGLGELRNWLVVSSSDAVIAIGGSWGTISELALAIRLGKPAISIGGWQFARSSGDPIEIARAETPEQAVDWVLSRLAKVGSG